MACTLFTEKRTVAFALARCRNATPAARFQVIPPRRSRRCPHEVRSSCRWIIDTVLVSQHLNVTDKVRRTLLHVAHHQIHRSSNLVGPARQKHRRCACIVLEGPRDRRPRERPAVRHKERCIRRKWHDQSTRGHDKRFVQDTSRSSTELEPTLQQAVTNPAMQGKYEPLCN